MTGFLLASLLLTGILVSTGTGYYATQALRLAIEENISAIHKLLQPRFKAFDHLIAREEDDILASMTESLPKIAKEISDLATPHKEIDVAILQEIVKKHGFTELYLIDKTGNIVNTTYAPDLNFNLTSISSGFAEWLNGIFGKGTVFVDRLILSTQTGILNQYGYFSPKGSDYIVEVSMDIRAYFARAHDPAYFDFLFHGFFLDAIRTNAKVTDLDLYMYNDLASWSVLKEKKSMDPSIARKLLNVSEVRVEDGDNLIVYSRFKPALKQGIFSQEFCTRVTYDMSDFRTIPMKIALFSLITLLIIIPLTFCSASWAINLRIISPLLGIIKSLERVGEGNYNRSIEVKGDREIVKIAHVVNQMQREILGRESELIKSKELMEERVIERTSELQVAKDRAEEANRLKDDFISLVSHDLRSPINNANMVMKLLIEDENSGQNIEKRAEMLSLAQEGLDRLLVLINKLLDISRLQTGKIEVHKFGVDVRVKVAMIWNSIALVANEKRLVFENRVPEGTYFLADSHLFGQVIQNLLTNAVKFSHSGSTITVDVSIGESHILTVDDNGIGISEEILPNLFRRDVKTSTVGVSGEIGAGLGLPWCHDIITAHGGELSVKSIKGEGSTFIVKLPRYEDAILIVDDQPAHRQMIKELFLKMDDFKFMEASNGVEAIESMKAARPRLVITDINMPLMDGKELIAEIRSWPEYSDIPLVAASSGEGNGAEGMERLRREVIRSGADDFVIKPVIGSEFIPRVKRFIQQ